MSSNKSERITIRVSKEEKDKIKILAIKKHITMSELCLISMMKYISSEEEKVSVDKL